MPSPYQLLTAEGKKRAEVIAKREFPQVFAKRKARNPNTRNYHEWLKEVALNEAAKQLRAS